MNKHETRQGFALFLFMICVGCICGCVTTTPPKTTESKKSITELKEPPYTSQYTYSPSESSNTPSGYTVGILDMMVKEEVSSEWGTTIGLDEFKDAVFRGLESILMAKGVAIKGPFDSFDEMTFPDRDMCSYLIRPVLYLKVNSQSGELVPLVEYTESYHAKESTIRMTQYFKLPFSATYSCAMTYEIYEPLTNQKLAAHKLDSDPIAESCYCYGGIKHSSDWNGSEYVDNKPIKFSLDADQGFNQLQNMSRKALEKLYHVYLPKTEALLSVEQFAHLDQYKKQLEERKRY